MPNDPQSLFDRHIGTFRDRLTAENDKPQTIKAYRILLKRLVSLIEAAGISPHDLTAERAAELVRNNERNRREPNKCQNIARRFVAHLITSGAVPAPIATPRQIARSFAALHPGERVMVAVTRGTAHHVLVLGR